MAVKQLNPEVARKIAAGEVIDRPNAIVRELMDNAVDSGAKRIDVEIEGGGIEKIRVRDNGSGMSKEDLAACAHPHATSKISTENDLLNLTTLGFRGEALSSMAAVSRLQITSGQWRMNASITEDHILTPVSPVQGTIVQTSALFENFPARRMFLKRPASEGALCKNTFVEKVLPRPDIAFTFTADGTEKLNLIAGQSLTDRFIQAMEYYESEKLFYEIKGSSGDKEKTWSFTLIIGEPSVSRSNRKDIFIYVNGRRIQEYSLVQAIEYGCTGYFPNGTHPVACLFVQMQASQVDFNIHPAKREARFKDLAPLHHAVSVSVRDFFKQYTIKTMLSSPAKEGSYAQEEEQFDFAVSAPSFRQTQPSRFSGTGSFHSADYGSRSQNESTVSRYLSSPGALRQQEYGSVPRSYNNNYIASLAEEASSTSDVRYVGSALGTFIIAEKGDTLYIIDQHAAHERYLYDKIMADAGQKQTLLVPYTVQTESAADDNYLAALQEKLTQAGFTGSRTGEGRWEFTTVPIRWKGSEADLAKDLLDRRISPTDMINAVAASTACRSAVMDGTPLDSDKAAWLARVALELPDPHCPHGRPVFTKITRQQLFALVKRT